MFDPTGIVVMLVLFQSPSSTEASHGRAGERSNISLAALLWESAPVCDLQFACNSYGAPVRCEHVSDDCTEAIEIDAVVY